MNFEKVIALFTQEEIVGALMENPEYVSRICDTASDEVLIFLGNRLEKWDFATKIKMAKNPNCPTDILRKLSKEDSHEIKKMVISNPNCPYDILREFTKFDRNNLYIWNCEKHRWDMDMVDAAISNPNCAPDILHNLYQLTQDEKYLWRDKRDEQSRKIIENPNCPYDILESECESEGYNWRSVIKNVNCTPELLRKYFERGRGYYLAIAKHPNCPPDVLEKIYKESRSEKVRAVAMANPNYPKND